MVDFSVTSPGCESLESGNQSPTSNRDQDRFLPIANISRIMRKGIPQNGKITKDSKEFVQECASEFVSFITSEASIKCRKEKRKTINGDDLLWAMSILGFEHYIDPLKGHLRRYKEIEGDSKGSTKHAGGSAIKNGDDGLAHQSSYSQDVNYANSQAQSQYMIASMQRLE